LVVGEVDDFCAIRDGLDMFFAQLAQEGVDVVLELVSLDLEHSASHLDILCSALFRVIFAEGIVHFLLLLRSLLLLLP
jgi:hypothetical protein